MITESEEQGEIVQFMEAIEQSCGGFLPRSIMMDKSKAEMAAMRKLNIHFLLCFFHLLQDWERFLRTCKSGVSGVSLEAKKARREILDDVKRLKQSSDRSIFIKRVAEFKIKWARCPAVLQYLEKEWISCAGK